MDSDVSVELYLLILDQCEYKPTNRWEDRN